jgi:hypothetical protein
VIGVVALRTRADGAGERVITWCCGNHRAGNCCDPEDCGPCCPECPTCPAAQRHDPTQRAADAAEMRERQMVVRVSARRAETIAIIAGLDELAAELQWQTRLLVDFAANADETDGVQGELDALRAAVEGFASPDGSS